MDHSAIANSLPLDQLNFLAQFPRTLRSQTLKLVDINSSTKLIESFPWLLLPALTAASPLLPSLF